MTTSVAGDGTAEAGSKGPAREDRGRRFAGREAEVSERWQAGVAGIQRLADGRRLIVVFPGVAGRGPGPDFRSAVLEVSGDTVVGDVEIHCREDGWRAHGHDRDTRYDGVVLHVVAENEKGTVATSGLSGRPIPILVLTPGPSPLSRFSPVCSGADQSRVRSVLVRLGWERLSAKSARLALLADSRGPAQALYFAMLEALGGPANRAAFGETTRRLPLASLLERVEGVSESRLRRRMIAAELRWAAAELSFPTAGQRPMASPERRFDVAAGVVSVLWPSGDPPAFPQRLSEARPSLPSVAGLGQGAKKELMVNAVLPVALLAGVQTESVRQAYRAIGSPGTYGHLRGLERWLSESGSKPFVNAETLQGAIHLYRAYCSRGMCGRCPVTADGGR